MFTCKKKTMKKLGKPCCPCPHCLNEKKDENEQNYDREI